MQGAKPPAEADMKALQNQYERVIGLDNLFAAAKATLARGRRFRGEGARFSLNLEREVFRLHRDLAQGRYRHGRYTLFEIQDPKPRIIAAASFRDRVVHHAVHDVIEPAFDRMFIHDSYACRRGKGTQAALDRAQHFLRSAAYSLHLDVERYFQSIDHGLLKTILRRYVADNALMGLLEEIIDSTVYLAQTGYCDSGGRRITERTFGGRDLFGAPLMEAAETHCRGLPLGNLTSQFFANLYLNELDQFVKHRLRVRGYVRYMDDLVLFHDDKAILPELEAGIREFAKARLRLVFHPSGGPLAARQGRLFLGFRLFRTHRRLKRAAVLRFERRMRAQQAIRATLAGAAERAAHAAEVYRSVQSFNAHAARGNTWRLRCRLYEQYPLIREIQSHLKGAPWHHGMAPDCRANVRTERVAGRESKPVSQGPALSAGDAHHHEDPGHPRPPAGGGLDAVGPGQAGPARESGPGAGAFAVFVAAGQRCAVPEPAGLALCGGASSGDRKKSGRLAQEPVAMKKSWNHTGWVAAVESRFGGQPAGFPPGPWSVLSASGTGEEMRVVPWYASWAIRGMAGASPARRKTGARVAPAGRASVAAIGTMLRPICAPRTAITRRTRTPNAIKITAVAVFGSPRAGWNSDADIRTGRAGPPEARAAPTPYLKPENQTAGRVGSWTGRAGPPEARAAPAPYLKPENRTAGRVGSWTGRAGPPEARAAPAPYLKPENQTARRLQSLDRTGRAGPPDPP